MGVVKRNVSAGHRTIALGAGGGRDKLRATAANREAGKIAGRRQPGMRHRISNPWLGALAVQPVFPHGSWQSARGSLAKRDRPGDRADRADVCGRTLLYRWAVVLSVGPPAVQRPHVAPLCGCRQHFILFRHHKFFADVTAHRGRDRHHPQRPAAARIIVAGHALPPRRAFAASAKVRSRCTPTARRGCSRRLGRRRPQRRPRWPAPSRGRC